jgi:hypothetical protein
MTVRDENGEEVVAQQQLSAPLPSLKKKSILTPYQLYMRENYVMLKQQSKDDKKSIFTKCHKMWESESDDIKAMYERKFRDEIDVGTSQSEISFHSLQEQNTMDFTSPQKSPSSAVPGKLASSKVTNKYMTNRSLNLESAVQFATFVAAHHVDVSTRDDLHLDASRLLERSLIVQEGLQEI